jgi:hypothetical protein
MSFQLTNEPTNQSNVFPTEPTEQLTSQPTKQPAN